MQRILDEKIYEQAHSVRIAYREGKADAFEEVKDLATTFLANAQVNPFRETTDFEQGQLAALAAIIEHCNALQASLDEKSEKDVQYDA